MHCNTAPFDNNDLRMALKLAIDREEMLDKILRGYGSLGNDFPINASYPLFSDDIEQRKYDPDKATFHYKKSGHYGSVLLRTSDVAFPGAVDAAQLYQQSAAKAGITIEVKREPGDGYWIGSLEQAALLRILLGRPLDPGPDVFDRLSVDGRLERHALQASGLRQDGARRRAPSSTRASARQMYRDMAVIVRDEGGLILPMFNQFIDATGAKVGGWVDDPASGTDERLRPGEVLARGLSLALRRCPRPS